MPPIPQFVARRTWWLVPGLVWTVVVATSLRLHLADLQQQSLQVAVEGARNMFQMVVLTRAWNAEHGGVYVPVTEKIQPNPYLEHPRRDLLTTDGQQLTLVNPAFMTRLISELAARNNGTAFHITSLKPIRPANAPDDWERRALASFEDGAKEQAEVLTTGQERQLRYMAPLLVTKACLQCHAKQGYKLGDIRGGISVSVPYGPVEAASRPSREQAYLSCGAVFLLVGVAGALLLEILRRRWLNLGETIGALQATRNALEGSNQALIGARDAAEAASLAKSAFLSNMSHELRTPLNAIMGFSHLLERGLTDHNQQHHLARIQQASSRLLTMINQLLDLSQAETGQLRLVPAPFPLPQLLAGIYGGLQRQAAAKALPTRIDQDPSLPEWVHGDASRIAQLLEHYCSNAVKFSDRGEIAFSIRVLARDGERVRLRFEVSDQGIGIGDAEQRTLFNLFQQVDNSSTRRYGGNGIGLVICKRLAELMDGQVGVVSRFGVGSRFWFEVPLNLAPPQATAPAPTADAAAPAARPDGDILAHLTRLLADDDIRAPHYWRQHEAEFSVRLGPLAGEIDRAISAFRFDAALEALQRHGHP